MSGEDHGGIGLNSYRRWICDVHREIIPAFLKYREIKSTEPEKYEPGLAKILQVE